MVTLLNGAEANPLNAVITIGSEEESKVYPVALNLNSIKSVKFARGQNANGEFNGMWIEIAGERNDTDHFETIPFTVSVKVSDATGVRLDDLIVLN